MSLVEHPLTCQMSRRISGGQYFLILILAGLFNAFSDRHPFVVLLFKFCHGLDVRFRDRALAAVRRRKVASRALVYEHHFHDISMSPSISSHAHTSELRSSLQPERIPATSAGLVRVKLCVESFIAIHIASLL